MRKSTFYVTQIEVRRNASDFIFLPQNTDTLVRTSVLYETTLQVDRLVRASV